MTKNINKAPDTDVYTAKKELETRIHAALVKLPKLVNHRLRSDSMWRIAECMNVNKNTYDFGRLPVYYKRPTSPRPKRYDCLRALATFIIVKWWDYTLEKTVTPFPTAFLEHLELIIKNGLDSFSCVGDYEHGFKLVTCKKCEDTGTYQTKEDHVGTREKYERKGELGKKEDGPEPVTHSCSCPLGKAAKVVCCKCNGTGVVYRNDIIGRPEESCGCPLGVARDKAIEEAIEPPEEPDLISTTLADLPDGELERTMLAAGTTDDEDPDVQDNDEVIEEGDE